MSNRLIQIGRVPLIPDPRVALQASRAFSASRDQTERVIELGVSYFNLLSSIRNGIRNFTKILERAMQIRSLSTMSDQSLADIGVRRDQLPQLYRENGVDNEAQQRGDKLFSESE